MTYAECVRELESLGVMPDRPPSLENTRIGLKMLGFENFPFWARLKADPRRVIVVAGTNGKGSVCATLEALLKSAGERVGLYTSPHLMETTERIRVDGKDVSEEVFVKAYQEARLLTQTVKLTHFEMITLMAIWIFCSGKSGAPVDRVVLEVGLGGIWDATNAVPHGISVLTPIGMDHENLLGPDLGMIAENKLGIVTDNRDWTPKPVEVVHVPFEEPIVSKVLAVQSKVPSRWHVADEPSFRIAQANSEPQWCIQWGSQEQKLRLVGKRAVQNTGVALKIFELLDHRAADHLEALESVNWPGRMERVINPHSTVRTYLSGDHNPHGARSLRDLLREYRWERIHFLVGTGADKNSEGILETLTQVPRSRFYLTEIPFRSRKLSQYGEWSTRASGCWVDPREAFQKISELASTGDMIVVTGSLYLVGEIKKCIGK